MKKSFQIVGGSFLALFLFFSIAYFHLSLQKIKQDYQVKVENLNQKISGLEKKIDENKKETIVANWENYVDEELGIEFKYPNDFMLKKDSYKRIHLKPTQEGVEAPSFEIKFTEETFVSLADNTLSNIINLKTYKNIINKDITIDGLDGKIIGHSGHKDTESSNYRNILIKVSKDKTLFMSGSFFDKDSDDMLYMFLSTIKIYR